MPFPRLLFYGSLAIHLISWVSPVYEGRGGSNRMIGAEAYYMTALGFTKAEGAGFEDWMMILSPHTNYLVILAVWATRWVSTRKRQILIAALIVALAIDSVWYFADTSPTELRFGYYLWLVSFPLVAGALWLDTLRKRTP